MYIGIMTAARLKQRQSLLLRSSRKDGWNIQLPIVLCQTCTQPIEVDAVYVTMERKHSPIRHGICAVQVGLITQEDLNEKLNIIES